MGTGGEDSGVTSASLPEIPEGSGPAGDTMVGGMGRDGTAGWLGPPVLS